VSEIVSTAMLSGMNGFVSSMEDTLIPHCHSGQAAKRADPESHASISRFPGSRFARPGMTDY
jgi:hypothetical protein